MAYTASFIFKATDSYTKTLAAIAAATKKHKEQLSSATKVTKSMKAGSDVLVKTVHTLATKFKVSAGSIRDFNKSMRSSTQRTKDQAKAIQSLTSARSKLAASFQSASGKAASSRHRARVGSGRMNKKGGSNLEGYGIFESMLVGGAMMTPLVSSVKAASDFEYQFAQIKKVMSDSVNPQQLAGFKKEMLQMTSEYPMTAAEIGEIAAAAGQAGIAFKDLAGFTKLSMEAASAFEMPASLIGDQLAKIKVLTGMTNEELRHLMDQFNTLDNEMASKGAEIIDVYTRVAGISKTNRVSAATTGAFASTLVSLGTHANMADMALRRMFTALGGSRVLPARGRAAIEYLTGMTAEQFNTSMQNDSEKALLGFFKRSRDMMTKEKGKNRGNVKDAFEMLFGQMNVEHMTKLALSYDYLAQTVARMKDKNLMKIRREFEIKLMTFNNQFKVMQNNLQRIGIAVGSGLLPMLMKLLEVLNPILINIAEFAEAHPKIAGGIVLITAAVGAFLLSMGALKILLGGLQPLVMAWSWLFGARAAVSFGGAAVASRLAVALAAVGMTAPELLLLAAAVAAIGAALIYAYNHSKTFRELMNSIANLASGAFKAAIKGIGDYWHWVADSINSCCRALDRFLSTMKKYPALKESLKVSVKDTESGLKGAMQNTTGIINASAGALHQYGDGKKVATQPIILALSKAGSDSALSLNKRPNYAAASMGPMGMLSVIINQTLIGTESGGTNVISPAKARVAVNQRGGSAGSRIGANMWKK